MVNAISHHSQSIVNPRSIHGQRHNLTKAWGLRGLKVGVGQKRPFQAGNLTDKLPRIYRQLDREYDRELKLNTPKIGRNYPEKGSKIPHI